MADSLAPQCTPLKREYDSCFNSWFEGYLEPAVAASASQQQREAYSRKKAEEFEAKCGKVWAEYKGCTQKALKEKGLDRLLDQAREENPLTEPTPSAAQNSK
ncbi:mitochondrial distribution/morphology family 35/apoptosis [Armillaria luteobubalina]|uniref:Mitochondrial distribution/morphology family 35/apoptosis n=1 Tax=Armillaria luteobubalina TaxID=153913 RepID=A0AA39Q5P7_9AGAR|nr:mitochondrial distribution/morphology family 35/apoptosis [Armillaria luteobubalina]